MEGWLEVMMGWVMMGWMILHWVIIDSMFHSMEGKTGLRERGDPIAGGDSLPCKIR
jgi:hypothetical protein